jgi:monoamine oxidase
VPADDDLATVRRDIGLVEPSARAAWLVPEDVIARATPEFRRARFAVVGGGVAGLTCAYILSLLGCRYTLFEAAERWGGRVWTLRPGDVVTDIQGQAQEARFPAGAYADAGATRIHPHMVTMHYAERLGVALEPFVARNDDALVAAPAAAGWHRARLRDVSPDPRRTAASVPAYAGRRSLWNLADAGDPSAVPGGRGDRLPGGMLHGTGLGDAILAEDSTLKSAVLLQPKDGADALVRAMLARLDPAALAPGSRLVGLTRDDDRVCIAVQDRTGAVHRRTVDYLVLATPPHLLADLAGDLPDDVRAALRVPRPRPAVKTLVGYTDRWWERRLGIYGGTSFAAHPVEKVWYPSAGLGGGGGILTTYSLRDNAARLGALAPAERVAQTMDCLVGMHGTMAGRGVTGAVSVSWLDVPHIRGAWVNWPSYEDAAFGRLCAGMGRIQFAGDWLSPLTAWQAGAYESAAQALLRLIEHTRETTR